VIYELSTGFSQWTEINNKMALAKILNYNDLDMNSNNLAKANLAFESHPSSS